MVSLYGVEGLGFKGLGSWSQRDYTAHDAKAQIPQPWRSVVSLTCVPIMRPCNTLRPKILDPLVTQKAQHP